MKSVDTTFLKKWEESWETKYDELIRWQQAYLAKKEVNNQEVKADMVILMQSQLLDELRADMRDLIAKFANYLLQVPTPNDTLQLYKTLCLKGRSVDWLYKMFIYISVDAFVDEPTEEEYEVLSNKIVEAYMKVEDCDLGHFSDRICSKYRNRDFTLEELKEMSPGDILEL